MKNVAYLVGLFFLAWCHCFAQVPKDFRETHWGMSTAEVEKSETRAKSPEKSKNLIQYTDRLGDCLVLVGYQFVDDKLCQGAYVFRNEGDATIEKYRFYKAQLVEKYGNLGIEKEIWKDKSGCQVAKQKGAIDDSAIFHGCLRLQTKWNLDKTVIVISLERVDDVLTYLRIDYYSKELIQLKWKRQDEEKLKQEKEKTLKSGL